MQQRAPHTLAVAYPSAVARPLTGWIELDLAASLRPSLPRPDQVTGVLAALYARVGGVVTSAGVLDRLTTGARAWLLARAASRFLPGAQWFQATCGACGQDYDLSLTLGDLPRAPKPDSFPVVEVATSLGMRRFEVPSGMVERALTVVDPAQALQVLVRETGLAASAEGDAQQFSDADLAAIEAALDAASPDVAEDVQSICPTCEAPTLTRIDPLEFAFPEGARVLRDVAVLARAFHWSEQAILDLPTARRRAYVTLITKEAAG